MTDDNKPAAPAVTYAQAGVDIDAGNAFVEAIKPHIRRTSRTGVMGTIGGFGGLFDLKSCGYRDPVLVAANDGVGTKLKLAFEMDLHHTVGIDLVAMSVNDLVVQGAEPLFFLDYFATGKLSLGVAERVIAGIAEGCQTAGCALIGGETAEMPGMYSTGEYDLAGFAVGAVERDRVLPRADVGEGDVLIGLASTGPHSNGYSLIRKLVADSGADLHQPLPQSGDDTRLGERLLTPTRIYVRSLLGAIRELGSIKALAHITGGGLTENIPRVLPDGCGVHIELDDWPRRARLQPGARAAFHWIHTTGRLEQAEMVRTFNCGVGMVAIAAEAEADRLLQWFEAAGETAFPLGRVTRQRGDHRVTYSGRLGFGA